MAKAQKPISAKLKKPVSTDERVQDLQVCMGEVGKILDNHKVEIGVWLSKKDIDSLHQLFSKMPGITEYKLEAVFRKD